MGAICGRCGYALPDGAALCGFCGTAAYPVAVQSQATATQTSWGRPSGLISSAPVESRSPRTASSAGQLDGLQGKLQAQGDAIAQSFGAEQTGLVKYMAWMVRSTCLDRRVARAAAQETGGTGAAIALLAILSIPGIIFGAMITPMQVRFVGAVAILAVITLLTWTITFLLLAAVSTKVVEVKLPVAVLVRVMTYPQTINVVGSIPLVGGLIGPIARIWSIVATAEAIREVTEAKAEKAILFAAFGALVQACVWMVLSVVGARLALRF